MVKLVKILSVAMVVLAVASLNMSTSCAPAEVTAAPLKDVAAYRSELPFRADAEAEAIDEAVPDVPFELSLSADDDAAPMELTWRTLTDVDFKDVYIDELDAYYWKPTFGASVKALEGKEVYITGYVIPVDYDEDFYVLSRYPFANCFFCGGAGPESVVDLRFKAKTRRYETDERLTFKGKFALNANDVYQMNYILEGAQEYKP